jgi:hypothetical protein
MTRISAFAPSRAVLEQIAAHEVTVV